MADVIQPTLYEVSSGSPVSLPEDQIPDAISSGKYAFQKGAQIPVIHPDTGEAGSVPSENAYDAFRSGYTYRPIADQQAEQNETDYGGVAGELKSAALGAANMMTFGGADAALSGSGLVSPDTLKGIEETNPKSNLAGSAVGLGMSHFYGVGEAEDAINVAKTAVKAAKATENAGAIADAVQNYSAIKNTMGAGDILNPVKAVGKLGGKVSDAVGGGVLGNIAAGATEGALFGAGNTVSEQALGDPDTVAESLLHNVGYGAMLGGGINGALGIVGKGVSKIPDAIGAASETVQKATRAVDQILGDTPKSGAPVLDVDLPKGVKTTSVQEIQNKVADAVAKGESFALPQQQAVLDAASRLPDLENPLHPIQADSLASQGQRFEYKLAKDMPSEIGDALTNHEALQKAEQLNKTDLTINNISPRIEPTANPAEAGDRLADAFTQTIEKNREVLGPAIDDIKNKTKGRYFHLPGIVDAITNPDMPHGNPKLANMFDSGGKEIAVLPYDTGMGISKKTYNNVSDMVDSLRKSPTDFAKLFDVRKAVTEGINVMETGDASKELTKVKAGMMDYIQSIAQKEAPDVNVRDAFRRFAINEENAQLIERKFGAEIGSDNFRSAAKDKPSEKILDKVFRDTETVRAAKRILSPELFNEALANHLTVEREANTVDGQFSSKKFFNSMLKGNPALEEAFADHPETLQRIKDLNTFMRILPDDANVNPSGSAKSLWDLLRGNSAGEILNNIKEYGMEKLNHQKNIDDVNLRLASRADQVNKLSRLSNLTQKAGKQLSSAVKNVFNAAEISAGAIGSKLTPQEKSKDQTKFIAKLNTLNNSPTAMLEHLTNSTSELYSAAPQVANSVHNLTIRATQFLASKAPLTKDPSPMSEPMPLSHEQLAKFDRYRQALDNPTDVLRQVKNGTLSNEALEAIQTVTPKLYEQMKQQLFSQISSMKNPAKIPYQTKASLSRFMGEPLAPSLAPQAIIASQLVYAQPTQQQQMDQKMKTTRKGLSDLTLSDRTSLHPKTDS